jgi:hypothetical protein
METGLCIIKVHLDTSSKKLVKNYLGEIHRKSIRFFDLFDCMDEYLNGEACKNAIIIFGYAKRVLKEI